MNDGWKCPNCGKAHAPWMATCDREFVTWSSDGLCRHEWVSDTAGTRCQKCGKNGSLPDYTITCNAADPS